MRSSVDLPAPLAPEHADLGAGQERQRDVLQHPLVGRVDAGQLVHREDVLSRHERSRIGTVGLRRAPAAARSPMSRQAAHSAREHARPRSAAPGTKPASAAEAAGAAVVEEQSGTARRAGAGGSPSRARRPTPPAVAPARPASRRAASASGPGGSPACSRRNASRSAAVERSAPAPGQRVEVPVRRPGGRPARVPAGRAARRRRPCRCPAARAARRCGVSHELVVRAARAPGERVSEQPGAVVRVRRRAGPARAAAGCARRRPRATRNRCARTGRGGRASSAVAQQPLRESRQAGAVRGEVLEGDRAPAPGHPHARRAGAVRHGSSSATRPVARHVGQQRGCERSS